MITASTLSTNPFFFTCHSVQCAFRGVVAMAFTSSSIVNRKWLGTVPWQWTGKAHYISSDRFSFVSSYHTTVIHHRARYFLEHAAQTKPSVFCHEQLWTDITSPSFKNVKCFFLCTGCTNTNKSVYAAWFSVCDLDYNTECHYRQDSVKNHRELFILSSARRRTCLMSHPFGVLINPKPNPFGFLGQPDMLLPHPVEAKCANSG